MTGRSCCLGSFVAILMLCQPLAAQEPRLSAVQMTVEDELGGVLVGAKVTLLGGTTQQTREGVTDETGRVSFDKLGPGEYTISAESPGFKTLERRLTVGTDRPKPLKLQLRIDVTERVEVAQRKRPLPQRENVEENADAVPVDDDLLEGVPMPVGRWCRSQPPGACWACDQSHHRCRPALLEGRWGHAFMGNSPTI